MADTNNTVDPVKWNAKGNKVTFGNVCDLKPDPLLNIRFRGGSEVFGIKVERDSYDLPGMKQQIVDGGGILEPITVSVRKDNTMVPLRGNRRTFAGQELAADPTTSADLRKALTERTPMILLHGLTPDEEQRLVNDQTQKKFLRSEVIRYIFSLRKQGWGFDKIAANMWETLGQFSGNAKKIAEIRDITDPTLKRDKIKTWLRGTLDNYILWGYDLGPVIQKIILQSEMAVDGLLPKNAEQPYFITTKNSQKRIGALKKAKEADGSKWTGMMFAEGSEFKKVADSFHAEDYGTTAPTNKPPAVKMLDKKTLEGMKDSFSSRAVRAMIDRVLGAEVPDLTTRDEFAAVMEAKEMAVEQYLPRLRPEIAAIVRMCFVNPDPTDFQNFLASNCVEEPDGGNGETGGGEQQQTDTGDGTFSLNDGQ